MYRTLFDVAAFAMAGWLLLILLPTWRVTRRIAESAVFPLFLCVLYVIGLVTVLREMGPGFMSDFGSAEGVLALLRLESVALIAWIHILAFDQVVGILIYRDNMKHRYVPLPLQSLLLAGTLMLGPVGFLAYWAARAIRRRSMGVAWGEREAGVPRTRAREDVHAPRFADVVKGATFAQCLTALWRRHPALAATGLLGFVLATVSAIVALRNGGWLLEPEGRLLEAIKFDVALGIYVLTLALILPLAPMSAAARRRWARWMVGLTLYGYLMENVQAWRGLDPRFSSVAGPIDQALGAVFFLQALSVLLLFIVLMRTLRREDALPDRPALRLSLNYATAGALTAFGVGVLMSVISGRATAAGADLMPLHAAGFHSLQAVPAVALLLGATVTGAAGARRLTHIGGAGWLMLCAGLVLQAVLGRPPLAPTAALALSIIGATVWVAAAGYALALRMMRAPAPA